MKVKEAVENRLREQVAKTAPETSEIRGDTWAISLPKTRIHTLNQLVEYCQIDLSVWEVERFVVNKWEVGIKVGAYDKAHVKVEPLFQVKAFLRQKKHVASARAEIEDLRRLAKKNPARFPPIKHPPTSSGLMLEVNICDAHFGKLAWPEETGGPAWDVKLADASFCKAFDTILHRTSAYKYDELWLILGNDLLNSDTKEGQTTSGTQVSNDTRYHKTFKVVRNTAIRCIERARTVARKVVVIMVRGNHDEESMWHLGDSLECYFHKCQGVEVDNRPRQFKYRQFGKVMLGFTHGDKGKRDKYPLLMATQNPEMFGETRHREIHTGHRHKTQLDEEFGIRVRILPALCPADDWHAENGLVGNQRAAEGYVWHKDEGLISIAIYTEAE